MVGPSIIERPQATYQGKTSSMMHPRYFILQKKSTKMDSFQRSNQNHLLPPYAVLSPIWISPVAYSCLGFCPLSHN